MVLAKAKLSELTFIEFFLTVILSWTLVNFTTLTFENLAFQTLGLSRQRFFDTLIVTLALGAIFVAVAFTIDRQIVEEIQESEDDDSDSFPNNFLGF